MATFALDDFARTTLGGARNKEFSAGVFGTEDVIEASGQREWAFTTNLSSESTLRSMLRCKESIGSTDDDINFITALARGLVNVSASWALFPFCLTVQWSWLRLLSRTAVSDDVASGTEVPLAHGWCLLEMFLPEVVWNWS